MRTAANLRYRHFWFGFGWYWGIPFILFHLDLFMVEPNITFTILDIQVARLSLQFGFDL